MKSNLISISEEVRATIMSNLGTKDLGSAIQTCRVLYRWGIGLLYRNVNFSNAQAKSELVVDIVLGFFAQPFLHSELRKHVRQLPIPLAYSEFASQAARKG